MQANLRSVLPAGGVFQGWDDRDFFAFGPRPGRLFESRGGRAFHQAGAQQGARSPAVGGAWPGPGPCARPGSDVEVRNVRDQVEGYFHWAGAFGRATLGSPR